MAANVPFPSLRVFFLALLFFLQFGEDSRTSSEHVSASDRDGEGWPGRGGRLRGARAHRREISAAFSFTLESRAPTSFTFT